MKFSNMKVQATNAVNWYFKRNWRREDMMNCGSTQQHAYTSLKNVYCTLFSAMLTATLGSYLHLIDEIGGLFTILFSVACLLGLYFTSPSPWRVMRRVSLLIAAAFSLGASVGLFTKDFFGIDQGFVVILLAGITIVFGTFWVGAITTGVRNATYTFGLIESWALLYLWFDGYACIVIETQKAHWMLQVFSLLILFTVYFVVYSQEILYDALYGDVNVVNCTFTVFFSLPAVVIHAARLHLAAKITQYRNYRE